MVQATGVIRCHEASIGLPGGLARDSKAFSRSQGEQG
jgi:hypothetical protein